jgi:2-keto-4-pentenoate hydratase/2-oxohepta-3-ene-1,7-dioic acid hydratase in catechol pathway
MKLVTYSLRSSSDPRIGCLLEDGRVLCLTSSYPGDARFSSMLAFIQAGDAALAMAREALRQAERNPACVLSAEQVRLLNPLPNPPLMRDWGTMAEHPTFFLRMRAQKKAQASADAEAAMAAARAEGLLDLPANWFTVPRYYVANPLNLAGPDDVIGWPDFAGVLDYELEIAIVVGRRGRNIPRDSARSHILGVMLFNDFTARDMQAAEAQPSGKSKDFDGSYALGPCIVTLDEIPDLYALQVRSRLNGEIQATDSTASMKIGFEDLIVHASRSCTLHAGEVFASGTFARGCGVETGRLLRPGDVIELEAEGIGTLRNTIGAVPATDTPSGN